MSPHSEKIVTFSNYTFTEGYLLHHNKNIGPQSRIIR